MDTPLVLLDGSIPAALPAADPTPPLWAETPARPRAQRASQAGHANTRRRKIDPTTCERDYSDAELEFMQAIQDYKMRSGRMFPTWSEVLEVLQSLGYRKSGNSASL